MTDAARPPSHKRTPPALDVESLLFAHAGPTCVLDPQGRLLAANSPALQLLKPADSSAWQGQPFSRHFTTESQTAWADLLQALLTDRAEVHATLALIDPAGLARFAPIELAARPIVRGRRVAAVQIVMRPIGVAAPGGSSLAPVADVLQHIVAVINSNLDVSAVLQAIVEQLQQIVPYDTVSLLLHEHGRFELTIARGYAQTLRNRLAEVFDSLWTTHTIAVTRAPLYIADTATDAHWQSVTDDNPIRSWLGVPLLGRDQDRLLGILSIGNFRPGAYRDEDVQVAFAFAGQAAIAIENARLYQESQRRANHMAVLNSVSATVSQSLDLETTLSTALDKALEVVGMEAGAISLLDEETQELVIRVHRGWRQQDLADNMRLKLGQGLSGQAVVMDEVIVTGSLDNESRLAVPQVRAEGVQAMVLAPMRARGRVVGVLGVMSYEPRTFAPQAIDVIRSIADQIGLAIDNARLFARVTRRSQHLALLNEVTRDVLSTMETSERLARATQLLCQRFGYDSVAVFMLEPEGQTLTLRSIAGAKARLLQGRVVQQSIQQGIAGWAARMGEPVVVGDVRSDERYDTPIDPALDHTRSELAVPLKRGTEVVGVLDIEHTEAQAFTTEDAEIMRSLADHLTIAITAGELYDQARQRVAELSALQEISLQVTASLDLWAVLDTIAHNALALIHADYMHICLYDADQDLMILGIALHADGAREPLIPHDDKAGLDWLAFRQEQPVVVNDVPDHPLYADRLPAASAAAFPLKRADGVVGVLLAAFLSAHAFTSDEVRVLTLLTDLAAIAVGNARLFEKTRRQLEEIKTLHELSLTASSSLDFDAVTHHTVEALQRSLGYEYIGLFLVNDTGDYAHLYTTSRLEAEYGRNRFIKVGTGIVGWCIAHGQLVNAPDVHQDPRHLAGIAHTRSELCVPLRVGEHVIGALDVQSPRINAFSADDERLLATIAGQWAVMLDNAKLYVSERLRRQHLEGLQATATAINAELDLGVLLNLIVEEATRTFGAQAAGLLMLDATTNMLRVQASRGLSFLFVSQLVLTREQLGLPHETSSGETRLLPRSIEDPHTELEDEAQRHLFETEDICGCLRVPVMTRGRLLGVLDVYSRSVPRRFRGEEIDLASIFSSQAAAAIENAQLYAETRRRLSEISILFEVAQAGASTLDLGTVFDRVLEAIRRRLWFETLEFVLYDPDTRLLQTRAGYGFTPDVPLPNLALGEGVVGWVAQQRQPALIGDVTRDPRYVPGHKSTQSELAVPLLVADQLVGVMNVESSRLNAFTSDDENLLVALAGQLAVLIDNARLHEETQQRLAEVSTLYGFAEQLGKSLDLGALLDSIVTTLREVLHCRGVSLALLDPDSQVLEIKAAAGLQPKWRTTAKLKVGEGISGQVAATATPIYVPDARSLPDFIFFDPAVRSLLVVPLMAKERVIGTLAIDQAVPDSFTQDDERVVTIAAAQAAVAIENAQLYATLKERANHLEQAYKELQEIDRVKDELVQNVSHELRTPLTFIKGYVELLLDGDMGDLNESQRESLTIVDEKTNALTRLVNDIIYLQRVQRESLDLSQQDLGEMARLALQSCEITALNAGIGLRLNAADGLPLIQVDRDRINQVFDNLLGNAIKFSPRGGTITIAVEEAGEMIKVVVSDTGIGIPPDKLDKVFDRFYQVDGSATRRYGGAGLGLAIVRRIVEAHGGRIWVESMAGQGSSFIFQLPKVRLRPVG